MQRPLVWPGRVAAVIRRGTVVASRLPRGARLAMVGVAIVAAFAAVVLPLFSSGGPPTAEVSGALPAQVSVGHQVRADISIDNTGATSVHPVCLAMSGRGAHLVSANFQGLDQVAATSNSACGGQLAAQQTISVTIVMSISEPGATRVSITPEQGGSAIGPPLVLTVTAS